MKNICQNRKAHHDYAVLEKLECGISLTGTEVKSCRAGGMSLNQAYVLFDEKCNATLVECNIAAYAMGNINNHAPTRKRQLLLHKKELRRLKRSVEAKGLTVIPLDAYFNDRGKVKLTIGLCRGKNVHDKRDSLREETANRETERAVRAARNRK